MKENVIMVELNQQEMKDVDGGNWVKIFFALLESEEIASEFQDGWNSVK